jgi:DNA-binding response OmpR family regulator
LPALFRVDVAVSAAEAACVVIIANLRHLLQVRATGRRAFIVVYGSRPQDRVTYLDAGADDVISTCSPRELAARIQAGTRRLAL